MLDVNDLSPDNDKLRECMKQLYKNKKVEDVIVNSFKAKNGYIKPFAGFLWEYPINEKGEIDFYVIGYPRKGKPLESISRRNLLNKIAYSRTLHVFDFIYDKQVKNVFERDDSLLRPHFGGLTAFIDVDAPDDPNQDKGKRYDSLSQDRQIRALCLNNFNTIKNVAKKYLKKIDMLDGSMWDYTKVMYSGNGMYIIPPDFYAYQVIQSREKRPEIMIKLEEYALDMMHDINETTEKIGKFPLVDFNIQKKWQDFHKIPFTLHFNYPRLSIPLNKEQPLRGKELIKWTDPFILSQDESIINEIIEKSEWD